MHDTHPRKVLSTIKAVTTNITAAGEPETLAGTTLGVYIHQVAHANELPYQLFQRSNSREVMH